MRGLKRDREGYYYRRRIPDDVRRALRELDASSAKGSPQQDKREEKKRLGRDKDQAEAAWAKYDREVEAKWERLRKGRVPGLMPVQLQSLAGDIYRRWLKAYSSGHFHAGVSAAMALAAMQEIDGEIDRQITVVGDDDELLERFHGFHVDAVLAARGLIVSPRTRVLLILAAQRAAKHACRTALKRHDGDLRPDPDENLYPAWPDPETTTLSGLCASWIRAQPKAKPKTHADFKASIDKFVAFIGRDDVVELSADDIRGWLAHLKESRSLSDVRIRDGYLAAIKTVLNSARKRGLIGKNPCDAVQYDGEPEERTREKDLRDGEVYAILKASLQPQEGVGEDVAAARRWVPWLLAYTGARVAEMTRLESKHIIPEAGVWGIDIQRSKNGRPRIVPIHRDLIAQGFLDFVRRREGMPLFFGSEKLKDANIKIHKTRAEGVAEWARKVAGIEPGAVAPNHGWRHRFKTECRRIAMDREVRLYIQGHSFQMEGEKYGFFPIDVTAAWMELFPRYDVSGPTLHVQRTAGVDAIDRAVSLLHRKRAVLREVA
ncbi:tyrosine-type recombinase/integrase [Bradyrhizobium elkanii]|uniref:tyrosine-type recombinase/integrase n=1 Tax=Bradyrhizobium elkanii TaxID=29448 RepID=UPI0004AEB937|nr:tyrosine-type recombinase/integrase [Bradyrhizobium elkanii]WLA83215.1 tyrosine-type recombinase/integrase [Bradyrhizobium elkanii]